jgi:hypothetical protein
MFCLSIIEVYLNFFTNDKILGFGVWKGRSFYLSQSKKDFVQKVTFVRRKHSGIMPSNLKTNVLHFNANDMREVYKMTILILF